MIPEFKFAVRDDLGDEFLPKQSDPEATGWDVRCAEPNGIKIQPLEYVKIRLGFRTFSPSGWWFELRPRSSSHAKKNLHSLYGVIDQTYENELIFSCQYIPDNPYDLYDEGDAFYKLLKNKSLPIDFGERIGQIIPVKRNVMKVTKVSNEEFDRLCLNRSSERKGGLGSTGDN
jgi:dUTPase